MLATLPISLFIFQTYSANNIVSLNDNFIEGETFEVILKRNSLGLGLSITGKPKQNKQLISAVCLQNNGFDVMAPLAACYTNC